MDISENNSKLNVEKVLNPPQNPMATKVIKDLCKPDSDLLQTKKTAKTRTLNRLAQRVPHGIELPVGGFHTLKPYLARAPRPPPKNIRTAFILGVFEAGRY
ncbi:MAG: hypothetical protein ACI9YL_000428 [Luteibaculaceae bacterium]